MIKMIALTTAMLAAMLTLIPHLIWMVSYLIGRCFGIHVQYAPFGWTAVILLAIGVLTLIYGYQFGRWQAATTTVEYAHPDVPEAFDGYRIVHISDMHLGTFQDKPQKLEALVERINALQPDLICFTGDLVSLSPDETLPFGNALSRLQATDGVASVLGNHDFFIYSVPDSETRKAAVAQLQSFEEDTLGWHLLRNSHMEICRGEEKLTIIGVDNINGKGQGFRTIAMGDLGKASEGCEGMRILLSHDPSHWTTETVPQTDIQLTLSGHTHAAQVRLFGWTPASWMFEQTDGRYDIGDQTLYVNIGLGCTLPVRIGARAEVTLITLHSK